MKKLFTAGLLIIGFTSFMHANGNQFCPGFERGYISGYKQSSGSSYDPYTPYCPYQPYKKYNDPESDYEHGYIIGYEKGLQKGRN